MSLAVPVSEENALKDRGRLQSGGKRLLVSAGIIALAFFFALLVIVTYGTPHDQSVAIMIGDYVITLGIAVPGLTLFLLRVYTDRSMRKGNAKAFTARSKMALVSVSWVALAVAVVMVLL